MGFITRSCPPESRTLAMPPSTSESHTFLPNSVLLRALPLRIMAMCVPQRWRVTSPVAETCSPSNTLRWVCQTARSRSPAKWEISSEIKGAEVRSSTCFAPARLVLCWPWLPPPISRRPPGSRSWPPVCAEAPSWLSCVPISWRLGYSSRGLSPGRSAHVFGRRSFARRTRRLMILTPSAMRASSVGWWMFVSTTVPSVSELPAASNL